MRRLATFLLLTSMLASLVAGCVPVLTPAATQVSTPTPAPTPTAMTLTLPGKDWGYPSPFAFYPRGPGYIRMSLLFDTLTWKDKNGIIPWLADSWEVSEDGTQWTFKLHPGVKWHDGQPLTAEDVAFTFDYIKERVAAFKWFTTVKKINKIEVVDDHTIVLYLEEPMAGFLIDVAGVVPIIPKHIWEGVEDPAKFTDKEAVIGSGPFKLVEYNKEEGRYIYEANPDYFKGKPAVDRLVFIKVKDEAMALKTGTVDAGFFWGKDIDAVKELEADPNLEAIEGPSFWVLQIIFNTEKPPFDKVEFRRAIAHAIDRSKIVEQVTHGGAIVANLGIISPGTDWYNPNLPAYEYDPSKAKEMLDELGVEDLSLTLLTAGKFAREAELIKADLEQIGIKVEVKSADWGTIDGLLKEGNFDLVLSGHGGIANPSILRSPAWPATGYKNDEYDRLFEEQSRTMDEEKRRTLVWQLQQIIAEELPVLTMYHPKIWCVYNPSKLDTWFYTPGGVGSGIPTEQNKLVFLRR
ncbi:MAG TPA: ABC transporter substrate-binding protein [Caldilineae bacterium]|nr:ABC transporter substrate-binding protein [Caldilineae bacterium]